MKKLIAFLLAAALCSACSSTNSQANGNNAKQPEQTEATAADTAKPADDAANHADDTDKTADDDAKPAADTDKTAAGNDVQTAKLLDPAALNETAPAEFVVNVATTKGNMRIKLDRSWAPRGVDRYYNLVKNGYFSDIALFRMVKGFVIQFGIHGKPILNDVWREARIEDDKVTASNEKGTLTFATSGPNSRTTQLFINLGNNNSLDMMGFAPIGKVIEGIDVLDKLNYEYGERPNQTKIQTRGNEYLKSEFPNLDYIISMTIEE